MPKYIKINTCIQESLKQFYDEISNQDIMKNIDADPYSNPNTNYNIMHSIINLSREKYIPVRYVKFHKYKHKKNKWITKGILKSIKFRDGLYKKLKISPKNFTRL